MNLPKIIDLVEGRLSNGEIVQMEQFLLHNPQHYEIIGGLRRIQHQLNPTENLSQFLERKKHWIRTMIHTRLKGSIPSARISPDSPEQYDTQPPLP